MEGYLGIDQSLTGTGLALVDANGAYVRSTTVSVGKLKGSPRLQHIVDAYNKFTEGFNVRGAASEGYSVHSTNRPFDLGGVAWVLRLRTFQAFGIEPADIPPASLKLYATGSGAADKELVLYTVKTAWGVDLGDRDNEADALALARFAHTIGTGQFSRRCEIEAHHSLFPGTAKASKARAGRPKSPNV